MSADEIYIWEPDIKQAVLVNEIKEEDRIIDKYHVAPQYKDFDIRYGMFTRIEKGELVFNTVELENLPVEFRTALLLLGVT